MEKLNGKSKNIVRENIEKLKNIFPEIVTEGKIDFSKLKETLGNYIDNKDERYDFTWNGKSRARRIAQTPSTGTLRPCKEESVNWDNTENIFIEGDNLEVLKLLQKSYHKKVKMIYIDPPYNTGNDFIYKDDYKDNLKNYLEITGQLDEEGKKLSVNPETSGRYHTDWLNMRNLLRDDGVIFISIDDNEVHNLRKICDEIFGEENHIGTIIWNSTKSVTNTAIVSVSHNYIFIYVKNIEYFIKNREYFRLPEDGKGFSNPDNDPRGKWKADPFQVGGWRPNQQYEIMNPSTKEVFKPNPGCSWKNDFNRFKELLKDNRIVFGISGEAGPQRKRFLSEALERGKVSKTLWYDVGTTTKGTQTLKKIFNNKTVFTNPKPIDLIERMIKLGDHSGKGIILDFFSGASSTAHGVIVQNIKNNKNNRFLMIQIPELCNKKSEAFKVGFRTIADIGKERIRRVIKKIKSEQEEQNKKNKETLFNDNKGETNSKLDLGFKVFKLDSSNIKTWDTSIEDLEQNLLDSVDNVKSDRSTEDVLYEILLKYGLDLTVPIEEKKISGKKIYSIGYGALIICLEKGIQEEVIKGIIKLKNDLKPEAIRVVFSDSSFKDDSIKMNAIENLKQNGIEDIKSL